VKRFTLIMNSLYKAILIFAAVLPSCNIAQSITGQVTETIYGEGIENVKVYLKGSQDTVLTDALGNFTYQLSTGMVQKHQLDLQGYYIAPFSHVLYRMNAQLPARVTIRNIRNRVMSEYMVQAGVSRVNLELEDGLHLVSIQNQNSTTVFKIFSLDKTIMAWRQTGDLPSQSAPLKKTAQDTDTLVFSKEGWESYSHTVTITGPLEIKLNRIKIKTLVIDGFSNHNWQYLTAFYKALFETSGFFTVAVATSPAASPGDTAYNAFTPEFSSYELVIMNIINIPATIDWPEGLRQEFEAYMANGGSMIAPHGANYSFSTWLEYSKMIGYGWRNNDFGPTLEIVNNEPITYMDGVTTSHPPRADAAVTNIGSHPCKKGFPPEWLVTDTEVYTYPKIVDGNLENITVLSYSSIDSKNWPMEGLTAYYQGLSYVNGMGHLMESDYLERIADVGYQTCLLRAGEWLARREIVYPLPANFPTADTKSYNWELAAHIIQ
jgi:hypothetical protein